MSAENEQSFSEQEDEPQLSAKNMDCLTRIKNWLEVEAEFYGRKEDDFLLMFLRKCKFDEEETKTALNKYYRSRLSLPKWWANRDINEPAMQALIHSRVTTALLESHPKQPAIAITKSALVDPNLGSFDDYAKYHTIIMENVMRRRSCQNNGLIWIIDNANYKYWAAINLFSPSFLMSANHGVHTILPFKDFKAVFVNASFAVNALIKLFRPVIRHKQIEISVYGSDWSAIGSDVSLEYLPEEYGGHAGLMKIHEDAFIKDILSYADYIADDNKYGFPTQLH